MHLFCAHPEIRVAPAPTISSYNAVAEAAHGMGLEETACAACQTRRPFNFELRQQRENVSAFTARTKHPVIINIYD